MSSFRRILLPSTDSDDEDEGTSLLRDAGGSAFSVFSDPGGYGSIRVNISDKHRGLADESLVEYDEDEEEAPVVVYKTWNEMWPICVGLWTAIFCSALSATIVANLQLEIGSYFKAGALASWLGTSFLLGLAAVSPLCGRLSQIIGRKGTLVGCVTLFMIGTIACALAPTMYTVLAARAVAGAGGGGLLTITAIILSDLVSPADRGLYQGGGSVLFGAGSAAGAVIGGAVAEEWGWRGAFWVQVPPIILALGIIIWQIDLPEPISEHTIGQRLRRLDWAGCAVTLISISALTVASSLMTNVDYGFYHPINYILIATALICVPIFVLIERRAKEPIVPLELLTQSQPAYVFLAFVLLTGTWFARMYMQPVYLQVVRGMDVLESGLLLIPFSCVSSGVSLYAGWHMRYFREYKWFQVVSSLFGTLQAVSIITTWSTTTEQTRIMLELCIGGLTGIVYTSLVTALILAVEPEQISLAISTCYLFRAIGQVLGVAISAAIQQSVLVSSLDTRFSAYPDAAHLVWEIVEEPITIIPRLAAHLQLEAREAYMDSIRGVFGFVVVGGVLMTVVCMLIRPQKI